MMQRLPVILTISLLTAGLAAADPLDTVFTRIDAAAKTFKGMAADISNTQHTALVDSDDVQAGTIKLLRTKTGQTRILIDWNGTQMMAFDGHKGQLYTPKTKTVDEQNVAEGVINQYLLLGFGAASADLKLAYDVTFIGDEKVDGRQTSHLRLVAKSSETKQKLKQADLWFGDKGLVVQQKFLRPSGDFQLLKYSNMTLGAVSEKDVELKLPKDVTIQKH
jgi:outer membrane lipoprotein-sorting protein